MRVIETKFTPIDKEFTTLIEEATDSISTSKNTAAQKIKRVRSLSINAIKNRWERLRQNLIISSNNELTKNIYSKQQLLEKHFQDTSEKLKQDSLHLALKVIEQIITEDISHSEKSITNRLTPLLTLLEQESITSLALHPDMVKMENIKLISEDCGFTLAQNPKSSRADFILQTKNGKIISHLSDDIKALAEESQILEKVA